MKQSFVFKKVNPETNLSFENNNTIFYEFLSFEEGSPLNHLLSFEFELEDDNAIRIKVTSASMEHQNYATKKQKHLSIHKVRVVWDEKSKALDFVCNNKRIISINMEELISIKEYQFSEHALFALVYHAVGDYSTCNMLENFLVCTFGALFYQASDRVTKEIGMMVKEESTQYIYVIGTANGSESALLVERTGPLWHNVSSNAYNFLGKTISYVLSNPILEELMFLPKIKNEVPDIQKMFCEFVDFYVETMDIGLPGSKVS